MEQAEPQPFESELCASTLQLRLGGRQLHAHRFGGRAAEGGAAATMAGRFRHSTISDSKRSLSALKSSSVRSSKSQPRWSHRSTRCPTISWAPAEGQALLGQVVGHIRRGQISLLRLGGHGVGVHRHGGDHAGGAYVAVLQGVGGVHGAFLVLLQILVVGKRQRLQRHHEGHQIAHDPGPTCRG